MRCKELQFILPLYSDNGLTESEQLVAERHMDSCPVCRQRLADLLEIRNDLRSVRRPQFAAAALTSLRQNVAFRIETAAGRQIFQNVEDRRRWVDVWLLPFAVGSLTSLLLGFTLLWAIVQNEINPISESVAKTGSSSNATILFPYSPAGRLASDLNPREYASSRSAWSHESPSINPQGSLVALTEDLANDVKDDEEVTVVADVYGNGSATIAQVLEPSSDARAVDQLQHALGSAPEVAAFVPASYDQRNAAVRVVLKIQNVNVDTRLR